ncbi:MULTISPECIES: class I SAM-dependent methyltransferase [Prosthecochloris]|nr:MULTISPECIES: class I SAM-dependent methyltransferase [Prosthecochloris]UZJ40107.1 methyltransferase domain-containing protein [Prosthecochloris sp. SCSIO W1102]
MMSRNMSQKESFWSRFASDFEKRNNYVAGYREIEFLKYQIAENKNLGTTLELGCGDGVFTEIIASNSEKVVATDWSAEMVEVTRQKFKDNEFIQVKQEDCLNLSFDKNSFDTVFMANLLHVIPNPEKALDECKRILKKDGRMIIVSFTIQGMKSFQKLGMLYRYIRTYGKPPKESRVLTTSNLEELLGKIGFEIKNIDLIGDKVKSVYAIAKM